MNVIPINPHPSKRSLGGARGGAHPLAAGYYLFLPAKEAHQSTCISSCALFDVIDGAFDIHYVNSDGKEITVEQALKPTAKSAAGKKP